MVDNRAAGPGATSRAAAVEVAADSAEAVRIAARAFERDRYLAALLAPAALRPSLLAIAAFAGEVARIPATVTEPMIGAIRLAWWRDAIQDMTGGGTVTGHPVADALAAAVRRHDLPRDRLIAFVDAQEIGLGPEPPRDDEALTAHLMATEGALVELALHVIGGPAAVERARPLTAAAQALGLTRLIVEFPALTAEGRTLVPGTVLAEAGLTADDLYLRDGETGVRIRPGLELIAAEAARHLALAERQVRLDLAPGDRIALAPLATVRPTLRAWRQSREPVFQREIDILPIARVMRVAWTTRTGRL